MDRPRPLPSLVRELSPRTKRSCNSSAEMFSSSRDTFFTLMLTRWASRAKDTYTRVPGMAYLQALPMRLSVTRDKSTGSACTQTPSLPGSTTRVSPAASSRKRPWPPG